MHAIGCIACCACLSAGGLGDLEERGVGAHVADLEAREVDAVDVGLGRAQVVLRYAPQPEEGNWNYMIQVTEHPAIWEHLFNGGHSTQVVVDNGIECFSHNDDTNKPFT